MTRTNTTTEKEAATRADQLPAGRQAIVTKYHPATNTRGSRISAKCTAGRVSIPYPHELREGEETHHAAARKLADKLGWHGQLIPAGTPTGYVFVQVPDVYAEAVVAVFETRRAISKGHNGGNPHSRPYGQAVSNLTDDQYPGRHGGAAFGRAFKAWTEQRDAVEGEQA